MFFLLTVASLVTAVSAISRTTAPSGCITIGSGGTYSTVSSELRPKVKTEYLATVQTHAVGTKFYNINIKNTYGKGSRALALSAYGDQQGYYGVRLYGYQDTLLSEIGNQVYGKCFIEGAVDFIFGQHARMWIDSSDIRVTTGGGAIIANGRASSSDVSYYLINKSSVSAAQGASVLEVSTLAVPGATGWKAWSSSLSNTAHVTFQEYGNTGSGASGTRASFSSELSSAISISSILGSSYTS